MSARSSTTGGARPNPLAALMERSPWLVSGLAVLAACSGFLLFNSWAARHAPALSQAHPLVALPCVLLIVVLVSIRFWPVRHGYAANAKASRRRRAQPKSAWRDIARNASAALRERGFILAHDSHIAWEPGANLVLTRDGHTYIVHARCWRDKTIDTQAVRELARDIVQHGAAGGMLLCPDGSFTEQARRLASMHGIATLGRADLVAEIQHGSHQASAHKPAPPEKATEPLPLDITQPLPLPQRPDHGHDHDDGHDHDHVHEAMRAAPHRPAPVIAPVAPAAPAAPAAARPVLRPDHQVNVRPDFAPTIPMSKADMLPPAAAAPLMPPQPVFGHAGPAPGVSRAPPRAEREIISARAYASSIATPLMQEPPPRSAPASARPDFAPTVPMRKEDLLPRAAPAAAPPPPVFDPADPAPAASRAPPMADHQIVPTLRSYVSAAQTTLMPEPARRPAPDTDWSDFAHTAPMTEEEMLPPFAIAAAPPSPVFDPAEPAPPAPRAPLSPRADHEVMPPSRSYAGTAPMPL